jgi:integrase/recombinase XerD
MAGRKLPKTLTKEEVDRLMAVPNLSAPTGLRNRAMLELMYRAGLRVGETCALHLRDVRWKEDQIHLRPEITKGGKEAFVYLDERAKQLLERWRDQRPKYAHGSKRLFITLQGAPVTRHYCYQMIRRYARRAEIERPVSPHVLRHTFATELLREGFDIRQVQTLMRHRDIRTTVIYTEVFDQELQDRIRRRS